MVMVKRDHYKEAQEFLKRQAEEGDAANVRKIFEARVESGEAVGAHWTEEWRRAFDDYYAEATRGHDPSILADKYGTDDKYGIVLAYLKGDITTTAGEIAAQQPNNTEVYLRALAQDRISQQLRRSNSLSAFHSAQRPRFLTGGL